MSKELHKTFNELSERTVMFGNFEYELKKKTSQVQKLEKAIETLKSNADNVKEDRESLKFRAEQSELEVEQLREVNDRLSAMI